MWESKLYPPYSVVSLGALTAWLFIGACTSARGSAGASVPADAGQVVADVTACPVTSAWNGAANAAKPAVTRCVLPRYPDDLRRRGVEGKVVVRVAVDSAGVPDSTSLQVVSATTAELATAAQRSVPHLRFAPARAGDSRPVVVEMPYTFTVTP